MTTIYVEMTEQLSNLEAKIRYIPVVVDGAQVYHNMTALRFVGATGVVTHAGGGVIDVNFSGLGGGGGGGTPSDATPQPVAASGAAGSAFEYSRGDHAHAHGNQAGGSLHAAATPSVDGFLSASDKTKLDGIQAGATAEIVTGVTPGSYTTADITVDQYGRVTAAANGAGGGAAIAVSDEGSSLTSTLTSLDFVGPNITATAVGDSVTVTQTPDSAVQSPTISSGTLTLNLATGRYFKVTLDANVTTLTFSNVPSSVGCTIDLLLTQDATGSRTFAWPSNFYFQNGVPFTVTPLRGDTSIFRLMTFNGGSTWICISSVASTMFSPFYAKTLYPSNVHYWFDFTDIGTLFQDTGATTPVTAAGQSIAAIKDKHSGSTIVLTQATAGLRPTYQVDGNGIGYGSFTSASQHRLLTSSMPTTLSVQDFTVVAASQINSGLVNGNGYGLWTMKASGSTSTNEPFIRLNYPNAFGYYNHGGSGNGISIDSGASLADLKTCSVLTREGGTNGNGGNRTMRVDVSDGRSATATPSTQNWSSASGTTFGIGYFDPTFTSAYGWGGRVYSVVGVNRKLAELEIDALFAFTKRYAVF